MSSGREPDEGIGVAVITVAYIDKLQRINSEDLAFYPTQALEQALDAGHILHCTENGEPAGYLWYGAVRPSSDVVIYQACIDYEARRRHLGWAMVRDLIAICRAGAASGIRLKCASTSDSNAFWQGIGFTCSAVRPGGVKRRRDLNCWRTDLVDTLLTVPSVQPSCKASDMAQYNADKRAGVVMPSPFSRTHYR